MNRAFLYSVLGAIALATVPTAEGKKAHRGDRDWWDRDHTRTIYVIENRRRVSRVVHVDHNGRYYRNVDGRRVYVQGRYFDSFPSRYFHPDGRPRVGISIDF